jgi:hypothetical protein
MHSIHPAQLMRATSSPLRSLITSLLCISLVLFQPLAHATVDDAHSHAMEAAVPFVEQGFIVREEYWNGEVKSAQQLMIKHQMFKGNEYAFWLGTPNPDVAFTLRVLDDKGKEISVDMKAAKHHASIRVNPAKSGTYSVIFSITSQKDTGLFWALAYGYR